MASIRALYVIELFLLVTNSMTICIGSLYLEIRFHMASTIYEEKALYVVELRILVTNSMTICVGFMI